MASDSMVTHETTVPVKSPGDRVYLDGGFSAVSSLCCGLETPVALWIVGKRQLCLRVITRSPVKSISHEAQLESLLSYRMLL